MLLTTTRDVHQLGDCPVCKGVGYRLDHGHLPPHRIAITRTLADRPWCTGDRYLPDNPRTPGFTPDGPDYFA